MRCDICPRACVKEGGQAGFCGAGGKARIAKAQLHFWEEPPISGEKGSGTVFFSGCNLRCVFCQNHKISREITGREMDPSQLADAFLHLQEQGAHNVNLVTPTQYMGQIAGAIRIAKARGLCLPIVYNTNAYENVEALKSLHGLIDIYLPDLKYAGDDLAEKYSGVKGYFQVASAAILEMHRQVAAPRFDGRGMMTRGLIIRHLILPGQKKDSMKALDWIRGHIGKDAYVSLLSQYFPAYEALHMQELNRRLTTLEYNSVVEYFFKIGLKNGFMQAPSSANSAYVPKF